MILRKREYEMDKGYLVISYRYQEETTSVMNWFMVVISSCIILFGILAYDSSFLGIRGFIIGVGVYLTYFFLIVVIDEIQIWFQDSKLRIVRTPLPWYERNSIIQLANIQKAVLKVRSNSSNPVIPWVDIEMKNGKTKMLLTASNIDETQEIIEEINRALRERRGEMVH